MNRPKPPPGPAPDPIAVQRRTLRVVSAAQVLGGAGLATGLTVGALLAAQMLGSDALGGLPVALFTVGAAGSAWLVGRIAGRLGRRISLTGGFVAGGIGAAGVVLAASADSVVGVLLAFLLYGAGSATNLQARYAGTDLAAPDQRARAAGVALVSTTFGAVAGPNLVGPMGTVAESWGLPTLTGPFLPAGVAYLAAALVIWLFLRPDPLLVARQLEAGTDTRDTATTAPGRVNPGVLVGATVMVLTQLTMVGIMTMTPLHMQHHGHGLPAVGLVIGVHIGAMYLPSLLTGRLVDSVGRIPMALAAAGTMLAAGLLAAFTPADSVTWMLISLGVLGLGWNLGLISGTALVVDATPQATRARTQGSVDLLIALAGSGGAIAAGAVVAGAGFSTLAVIGGLVSVALIPVVAWSRRTPTRV